MTDTTATPTAPVAPQIPAGEAVIDTNPQASPNAITNAPPDAPTAPMSRRDAIKAAFDRATAQQDGKAPPPKAKAEAKPADAKTGHNNPPEAVDGDKPKLNLKKRPGEQDAKTLENPPQPRDRGRFAPREPAAGVDAQNEPGKGMDAEKTSAPVRTLPENAPYRDPLPRMTEAAKAAWADTPETVRADIHRVNGEFAKAYQGLKGAHDAYQPVARFDQMARQHGTTLEQALTNYTSMEAKLRSDVVGGLDVIINNLGLKSPDGQKIGLRDIAYHVLSQSPDQLRQVQMGNTQQAANLQIGSLHQEIAGLKQALHQMHSQQQFAYKRSEVDQFAASHPRFDELGTLIEQELRLGFDLESSYRRAELLKPATTAAQTRDTAPQTRTPADRSISGSPGGATASSSPSPRAKEKPTGRREAIANAIKRVNGGV